MSCGPHDICLFTASVCKDNKSQGKFTWSKGARLCARRRMEDSPAVARQPSFAAARPATQLPAPGSIEMAACRHVNIRFCLAY